jgi:phosphate/sulfate permease
LGLASITGLVVVAPWVILTCLTSGLAFTISSFFYERIVNPEGKHDDLAKVMANQKAQHIESLNIQTQLAAALSVYAQSDNVPFLQS